MNTDNIPDALATDEMKQALGVMVRFSENQQDYLLYQSRLEAELERNTYIYMLEEERKEKERERLEKEQAQAELNDLLNRLKEKGISPDTL